MKNKIIFRNFSNRYVGVSLNINKVRSSLVNAVTVFQGQQEVAAIEEQRRQNVLGKFDAGEATAASSSSNALDYEEYSAVLQQLGMEYREDYDEMGEKGEKGELQRERRQRVKRNVSQRNSATAAAAAAAMISPSSPAAVAAAAAAAASAGSCAAGSGGRWQPTTSFFHNATVKSPSAPKNMGITQLMAAAAFGEWGTIFYNLDTNHRYLY